jgi:large subunit ribosomal protein L13
VAKKEDGFQRTYSAKEEEIQKKWYVVDASGQTVGRLATQVARILRGKHKPQFTPHVDVGDFVVVINAGQIQLTGKREDQKEYYHNTLYPGGARFEKFKDVREEKPEMIVERAVKGMLPKNSLGHRTFMKLKVYAGAEHPHQAQSPEVYTLN